MRTAGALGLVALIACVAAAASFAAQTADLNIVSVTIVDSGADQAAPPAARLKYRVTGDVAAGGWSSTEYQVDAGPVQCVSTPAPLLVGQHSVDIPFSNLTLPGAGAHAVQFRLWTAPGCGGDNSATYTIDPAVLTRTPNNDVFGGCSTLKVTLILDESGSITDIPAYTQNVRDAATAFVNGLSGTGSSLAVVAFGSSASTPVPVFTPVTPAWVTTVWTPYITNTYGQSAGGKFTNWEDALTKAQAIGKSDLLVFITDGDPTAYGTVVPTTGQDDGYVRALKPAFLLANAIKAGGTHMLMVGVGNAVGADPDAPNKKLRLKGVSGDDELLPGAANVASADVAFVSNFSDLQQALTDIVTSQCQTALSIVKTPTPTTYSAVGASIAYSYLVTNTGNVALTPPFTVSDNKTTATCPQPASLAPNASITCSATYAITLADVNAGSVTNTASASGMYGNQVVTSPPTTARVTYVAPPAPPKPPTPPPAPKTDIAVTKAATASVRLPVGGGSVPITYSLVVTNNGPDTAANVKVADAAPAGVTFVSSTASAGTCTTTALALDCAIPSLAKGASATITINATVNATGTKTNTVTVTTTTPETNSANNTAQASTLVAAPLTPPQPTPAAEVCSTVAATPKTLRGTGKAQTIRVSVKQGSKALARVKVRITGPGLRKTVKTGKQGKVALRIKPKKPGIIRVEILGTKACNSQRLGVVGVFEPPITG